MDIIAHRGASYDAPENTLAAARLAWGQGADALELDVQLTADGQLAVIHDDDAWRVAGVATVIRSSSWAELARLDVGRWKDPKFAGERIPLLAEMLATAPRQRRVFVEIKGGVEFVPPLTRVLESESGPRQRDQVIVIGFNLDAVRAAKRAMPDVEMCWIVDYDMAARRMTAETLVGECRAGGIDGVDLSAAWPIDKALVRTLHAAGLKVYVWTVDDAGLARRLRDAGIDGLATNRPGWMREQIG